MKRFNVSINIEAENGEEALKKADEKILDAIRKELTICNIMEVDESLPTIDSWEIMMETEDGDKIRFNEDMTPELMKRIDETIGEHYPVTWFE